ncbi:2,3,4,5-tetrahydropyridine-2,6-dicarboxylate N-acetyltransferase [Pantoea ananatis]|uniref:acyltransferase n=1 Tax=Pantoea ananas TaxID=553 RepID=UPI000B7CB3F4|nr:acyltransferase [Pantoea ananatis]AWQ18187.1 acyltransferase [Pantoea ananatis]MCK0554200.1 acyltransferase [Pantoea ananatis]MCW0315863.1 2,3,4,5-tetrahydropyridine-2,6-dicarboxylate N-acetyltransferase [Pantoea ananatis]MCW0334004.1 2,3,4,5-tetrahydropyridine-2,6-dicarboxylate N-acetyltransferase [Pantoea ananatis]MCW0382182.1 2,3,4,5-tetrahydropyridine-2,6-dicarboxylate N-acetyltransferase [Pantoea ananatis]
MKLENISLGDNVTVDPSTSINNLILGDNVKIAKRCSIFGSKQNILEIGKDTYVGMNTILNGYSAKLKIGSNVSIAQNVNIMTDSGPNASPVLQKIYPIIKKEITINDHCWIGASVIVMPGVTLGKYCVVAANSFVDKSFDDFSIIGGTPARLLKKIDPELLQKD